TGLVDDEERERGRRRTRDALRHKARQGHVTGGVVFGFRNVEVRTPDGKRSHVGREVVPEEATVLREMGKLYIAGRGFCAIAKTLNAARALAPAPRRRNRPRGWSPSTVRACLLRPDYRGELV